MKLLVNHFFQKRITQKFKNIAWCPSTRKNLLVTLFYPTSTHPIQKFLVVYRLSIFEFRVIICFYFSLAFFSTTC